MYSIHFFDRSMQHTYCSVLMSIYPGKILKTLSFAIIHIDVPELETDTIYPFYSNMCR